MKKITSLSIAHALLISLFAPYAVVGQQTGPVVVAPPPPAAQSAPPKQGQQERQPPSQQRQTAPVDEGDEVVRITTNLVQVDAVVVDKKGKQVTDLTADDFEIFEDERAQKLTNFSYVLNEATPRPAEIAAASRKSGNKTNAAARPAPPRYLRPEQVRRTMALVVDDLGLSSPSMISVRAGLRKFVDEQMQPDDLVAIVRTSAGVGALQQFTSDKRQLHAAIDRVRWYPGAFGSASVFASVESSGRTYGPIMGGEAGQADLKTGMNEGESATRLNEFQEEIFAVGALGALNFVVRGMRELPGRKSVTLFSDGFSLRPGSDRVRQAVRQLTDLANRASVVFYTIDPRGLVAYNFMAEDDTSGMTLEQLDDVQVMRARQFSNSHVGLDELSHNTGGLFIKNMNNLDRSIRRIIADQRGFYLLGYRPQSATFDRRYHKLEVRVKRPGLKVRYRRGFFGIRDEEARPVRRTRYEQLLGALTSPFAAADVRLRLTAVFGNTEQGGSFMTSLMHIDGNDMKFDRQPDGTYKTVLDVVGLTYRDNAEIVDNRDQTTTLTLKEDAYRRVLHNGLTYSFNVPIKKAGAYQLRMAVRDASTTRTGSASQFIEVPDLKKNRLALSGLIVGDLKGSIQTTAVGAREGKAASGNGAGSGAASPASPAIRRFRQNSDLDFAYAIYNARLDKSTRLPQLTTQARIFRDGTPVFDGDALPLKFTSLPDPKRLDLAGSLNLGANLPPGEYVLQIVVTDLLAGDKHRAATQWIDFEVVK